MCHIISKWEACPNWVDWSSWLSIQMARSPVPAVKSSFIPPYLMTLFIGMLGYTSFHMRRMVRFEFKVKVSGQLHATTALPQGKSPSTHWIGGSVNLRAGLDDAEKRKFLTLPGLKLQLLRRPVHSQSLYRLSYPGSQQNHIKKDKLFLKRKRSVMLGISSIIGFLIRYKF
jgi:hypothetical protein